MDHHIAVAIAFLAIGLIVACASFSHHASTAAIYSTLTRSHNDGTGVFPATAFDEPNSEHLIGIAREGARWSKRALSESHIWAIVILVGAAILLGYVHTYGTRRR